MSVIKLIDVKEDETVFYGKKHLIQITASLPNQELFYDGKKVSSVEFQPTTRHIFMVEENGKPVFYEVFLNVKTGVAASSVAKTTGGLFLKTLLDPSTIRLARRAASIKVKDRYECYAAVIRDGKTVLNEGILKNITPINDLKKELKLQPQGSSSSGVPS